MIQRRTQVNSKKSTFEKSSNILIKKQEIVESSFTSMKDIQPSGESPIQDFKKKIVSIFPGNTYLSPWIRIRNYKWSQFGYKPKFSDSYPTHNQFCSRGCTQRRFAKITHFLKSKNLPGVYSDWGIYVYGILSFYFKIFLNCITGSETGRIWCGC